MDGCCDVKDPSATTNNETRDASEVVEKLEVAGFEVVDVVNVIFVNQGVGLALMLCFN